MPVRGPTIPPVSNWAGNVRFGARRRLRPSSLAELREIVAAADTVRAVGTGHSFNPIADTAGDLVTVADLPPEVDIDAVGGIARVAAGLRYADVTARLHAAGWALRNLASLSHTSIAGSCATGTHGSGDGNGNLSTAVVGLELVTADGELMVVDDVSPWVVGLGALGVVTHLTLTLVPAFEVAQHVYDDTPLPARDEELDELFAAGYSVSLFTRWTGREGNQVWLKQREGDPAAPPRWLGGELADGPRHPIAGAATAACTQQLGIPGPWHERLPHFRPDATPSAGDELQSEYLVPREQAMEALAAVDAIGDRIAPVLHVSELRTVAADELWLSPSYRRDSLAIHFTWRNDPGAVAPVIAAVEERLAPCEPRPHWGKLFTLGYEALRQRYERYDDFADLARRHDPTGKFRNGWLARSVFGERDAPAYDRGMVGDQVRRGRAAEPNQLPR